MIINNNDNNQDCQLNFFRRVLKRLIAPWAWNFGEERIPLDKIPDISQIIQIGRNGHWILNGADTGILAEGKRGMSAYEVAVSQGFSGTESEWLASLKGGQGERGLQGVRGPIGLTGETGEPGIRGIKGDTPTIIDDMWYISGINTGIRALGRDGLNGVDGKDGNDGENGQAGISIVDVTEYYLASSQNTGISRTETPGWTITMQQMTPTKRYLWSYKDITYSDNTHQYTPDIIIGVYGNTGSDAVLNAQQEELLQTVSEDLGDVNSKLGELATYNNAGHITGITSYLSTKIEDTIAGFATSTQVPEGGGSTILQTLFAKIDGPNSPMTSLIQAVDPTGASISSIAQLGQFIGSISTKVDAQSVETTLGAVLDINGEVTEASIVAAINRGNSIITAHANNFSIINSANVPTFRIESNGDLTALGNATFTGNIVARSITLGTNVTIPQSGVAGLSSALNGKANDETVVKKDTILGTLPAIGATSANTSGFMVDSNGLLTASNAVIYGTVYATNGSFSGEIEANSGHIGDWSIEDGCLVGEIIKEVPEDEVNHIAAYNVRTVVTMSSEATIYKTNQYENLRLEYSSTDNVYRIQTSGGGKVTISESLELEGTISSIYGLYFAHGGIFSNGHNKLAQSEPSETVGGESMYFLSDSGKFYFGDNTGSGANSSILVGIIESASADITTINTTTANITTANLGTGTLNFQYGSITANGTDAEGQEDITMNFKSPNGVFQFSDDQGSIADSDLYTGTLHQASDKRLKENITDLFINSETIAQMPSIYFNFIGKEDKHVGTIAQEWQKILPEVVKTTSNGTLSMDYASTSMVCAISLAKEIVKLKEEIEELKEAVNL